MRKTIPLLLALCIFLPSCSREHSWKSGNYFFEKGLYIQAIKFYKRSLKRSKTDEERAETHLALARCHSKLGNFSRAREDYEETARLAPFKEMAQQARQEMISMEDYFPLASGARWEEVDKESQGKNLYTINIAVAHPSTFLVRRSIFPGRQAKKLVKEILLFYSKAPGMVWERSGNPSSEKPTLLLRYPYTEGSHWDTWREGRRVRRVIVKDKLSVTVGAGTFYPCIEVAEGPQPEEGTIASGPQIFDTYCVGVGRVQTAAGTVEQRTVFSQLASFRLK